MRVTFRMKEGKLGQHDNILHEGQRGIYRIYGQIHLFWHPTKTKKIDMLIRKKKRKKMSFFNNFVSLHQKNGSDTKQSICNLKLTSTPT